MCDASEPESASTYRRAYGEAARLIEIARFDHCFGRDFAAGIGSRVEAIEAEVVRRMGARADGALVKLAIRDALAGRDPRW